MENDDVTTFTAHFASGAVGTFSCSRVAWGLPNSLMVDVLGTKGRASWDLARCGEIKIDDVSSPAGLGGARRVLVNPDFPYFARGSSMAYGAYTACLQDRSLPEALDVLKDAGLTGAEVNVGGFIPSPHCPVDTLLAPPPHATSTWASSRTRE